MDKIQKFLKSLTTKEREAILLVMFQVTKDFTQIPGLAKMAGYKNLFRVRIGRYRIIFKIENKKAGIVKITKRDEQTYKFQDKAAQVETKIEN